MQSLHELMCSKNNCLLFIDAVILHGANSVKKELRMRFGIITCLARSSRLPSVVSYALFHEVRSIRSQSWDGGTLHRCVRKAKPEGCTRHGNVIIALIRQVSRSAILTCKRVVTSIASTAMHHNYETS